MIPLLQAESVSVIHTDGSPGLQDINISLGRGRDTIIVGPEGNGAPLLMDLLLARTVPTTGRILYKGRDVAGFDERELEAFRGSMGYVPPGYGLINNLSVAENIALPLRFHTTRSGSEIESLVRHYLHKFHLQAKADFRPQLLTASERLRTSVVRALIHWPELLMIDGALEGHCPVATAALLKLIRDELHDAGIPFAIITYNTDVAKQLGGDVILLVDGLVHFMGSLADMEISSDPVVAQYLHNPGEGPIQPFRRKLVAI